LKACQNKKNLPNTRNYKSAPAKCREMTKEAGTCLPTVTNRYWVWESFRFRMVLEGQTGIVTLRYEWTEMQHLHCCYLRFA